MAAGKEKREEYRETTLEDLEKHPMPRAQKVVIAAAVVILVGFILYYNFIL